MRKYYRNRVLTNLQYRTTPNSDTLEVAEIGFNIWRPSTRNTLLRGDMRDLYEVRHPQSWLFATITFTLALLTLAYSIGGA